MLKMLVTMAVFAVSLSGVVAQRSANAQTQVVDCPKYIAFEISPGVYYYACEQNEVNQGTCTYIGSSGLVGNYPLSDMCPENCLVTYFAEAVADSNTRPVPRNRGGNGKLARPMNESYMPSPSDKVTIALIRSMNVEFTPKDTVDCETGQAVSADPIRAKVFFFTAAHSVEQPHARIFACGVEVETQQKPDERVDGSRVAKSSSPGGVYLLKLFNFEVPVVTTMCHTGSKLEGGATKPKSGEKSNSVNCCGQTDTTTTNKTPTK